jgi:macrolide transport system ATP-binding/permease protein
VAPMLGRDFRDAEESPGAPHTAILSYDGWQKRFGGKPDVLGQTLMLNGDPTTIIGVLPRNFQFAPYGGAEFWGNLRRSGTCERDRNCWNLIAIGRLRSGVSLASASHEMQSIVRRLRDQYPDANRDLRGATLVPLREVIIGDIRPVLLVLLTGAGLLLSIACIDVMSLLIARSEKRQREIALRGALGASRSRLFLQFAMEGLVLAALGCLLALFFADSGSRFLIGLIPPEKLAGMPFLQGIGLHALPLMLACTLSLLAAIVFALVPLAGARGSGLLDGLKEGERGSAGRMWRRFGANLVVFEVAIAMMLLVGAGLLGKSLYLLLHVDLGFDPNHLARVQVTWSPGKYDKDEEDISLARRIVERVSRLPGVQSVGLTLAPPIDSAWGTGSFHRVGAPNHGETNEILNRQVSSAYFATLRARLIRGRYFREDDNASKPRVAIVNRTLAERYFKGEEAVGKQIYYDWEPKVRMQIVGVIDDIKEGPLEGGSLAALYVPYDQVPCAWPNVLVRSSQPAARLLPAITRTIHGIDPFLSVSGEETMSERIEHSPSAYLHTSSALLVGLFAASAFLLSVVGLYGVVAYAVSQRTREIGIRMALGAERTAVYQLILAQAGGLIAAGIGLGLGCSLAAAILMRALLFGVRSWDVPTMTVAAAVLGGSALVASYVPARRAAAVNPLDALRAE